MSIRHQAFMSVFGHIVLRALTVLTAVMCLIACSDKSSDTPDNHSPSTPTLLQPLDGAVAMPTSVTLTWEATDPDGDSLTFAIILEDKNPPASSYLD